MAFVDVVSSLFVKCMPRVRVVVRPSELPICGCSPAIVFVHAVWSGVSSAALIALDLVLAGDVAVGVPVLVVDADLLSDGIEVGGVLRCPQGKGETYLVGEGVAKMVFDSYTSDDRESIEAAIKHVFG